MSGVDEVQAFVQHRIDSKKVQAFDTSASKPAVPEAERKVGDFERNISRLYTCFTNIYSIKLVSKCTNPCIQNMDTISFETTKQ